MDRIADLLARLGFEPDENGLPRGDWPTITKTDPRVLLDAMAESVQVRPDGMARHNTQAWKADVLEAATLIWAGVIDFEEEDQIREVCPFAGIGDVTSLLLFSDLEGFWNRPGVGKSVDDIRQMWDEGKRIVDPDALADWLRRARGGTSRL